MPYEAFEKPFFLLSDSRLFFSLWANASSNLAWAFAILSLSPSTIANSNSIRALLTLNFRSLMALCFLFWVSICRTELKRKGQEREKQR